MKNPFGTNWKFKKHVLTTTALVCVCYLAVRAFAIGATDICKNKTIQGVVGTMYCPGVNSGTGVVPSPVDLSTVATLPTTPVILNESPSPTVPTSGICNSVTVIGLQGDVTCDNRTSMNHTDKGVTASKLTEDFATTAPAGRLVVKNKDDDGQSGTNVTFASRAAAACGVSQATLADKIADCTSTWLASNGNSGQGSWTLVQVKVIEQADPAIPTDLCTGGNKCSEIWRDDRTQLLWSDVLHDAKNWCHASGSKQGTTCSNATNQDQTTPFSLCAEDGGHNTDSTYDLLKGEFRLASGSIKTRWWLPTRYDWMEAEENGIRFVLPQMNKDFWSASALATDASKAWLFSNAGNSGGGLSTQVMTNTLAVRCVGQYVP